MSAKRKKTEDAANQFVVTREEVVIPPPNFKIGHFKLIGVSPLVINRFSEKAKAEIRAKHEKGKRASKAKRDQPPRDFKADYEAAKHVSMEGWLGIPAISFRAAMVSACKVAGYAMTRAKLAIFVVPDGFDDEGTPLVKITKGKPKMHIGPVRNSDGSVDLRSRPMWDAGWEAEVKIEYDADMMGLDDIANLLTRVGKQVGIVEGRADSKKSVGCGWGVFRLGDKKEVMADAE